MIELDWIAEARKHINLKEIKGIKHNATILLWLEQLKAWWKEDETPWCGVFVAYCLKASGVKYPKHWYRALDYLNYGAALEKPCYGCVAIKTRKGGGHVCFVVGTTINGDLVCIGGNQNNMVSYAIYKQSDFDGFRWYGRTNTPSMNRFNLPVIKNVTSTKVTES